MREYSAVDAINYHEHAAKLVRVFLIRAAVCLLALSSITTAHSHGRDHVCHQHNAYTYHCHR